MTFAYALSLCGNEYFDPSSAFRRVAEAAGLLVWRGASQSDVAKWALQLSWAEKSTIISSMPRGVTGCSIQVFEPGRGYWEAFHAYRLDDMRGE